MAKNEKKIPLLSEMKGKAGFMEYKMSKEMADSIWFDRPKNTKVDKQTYLRDWVNDEFGLQRYCVRVLIG